MLDFADRTGSSIFMEVWPQMCVGCFAVIYSDVFEVARAKIQHPTCTVKNKIQLYSNNTAVQ